MVYSINRDALNANPRNQIVLRDLFFVLRASQLVGLYTAMQKKKVSDMVLIDSYARLKNVWKVGEEVGLCGQVVHARLKRLKIALNYPRFTADDLDFLDKNYQYYANNEKIEELAKLMGRTKSFLCRKARELHFTNPHRLRSKRYKEEQSRRAKKQWQLLPHPRGNLGHHHSEKIRKKIGKKCKENWAKKSPLEIKERGIKMVRTKLKKYGKAGNINMKNPYSRCKRGKRADLNNQFFRSSWEANWARYLNFLKERGDIKSWKYEPKTFRFRGVKRAPYAYLPDFKIICKDGAVVYQEVKGWERSIDRSKFKRMAKFFPKIKLEIIDQKRYKSVAKWGKILSLFWE